MELKKLNSYVNQKIGMELITDKITAVKQVVEDAEKAIEDGDMIQDFIESDKETIEELKKYIGYDCAYAVDIAGDIFGQGFVICDKDFNYIGFVRTI